MRTYFHSKIESFRQCPRKFYYRYIAKVELEDGSEQVGAFMPAAARMTEVVQ